jgi:hypothetical protein
MGTETRPFVKQKEASGKIREQIMATLQGITKSPKVLVARLVRDRMTGKQLHRMGNLSS